MEGWGPQRPHERARGSIPSFFGVDLKPPKCSFCSVVEWRHVCGASNKEANASNTDVRRKGRSLAKDFGISASGVDAGKHQNDSRGARDANPKQRWSRDAYNAYQRDLMRKRRSEAKARARLHP